MPSSRSQHRATRPVTPLPTAISPSPPQPASLAAGRHHGFAVVLAGAGGLCRRHRRRADCRHPAADQRRSGGEPRPGGPPGAVLFARLRLRPAAAGAAARRGGAAAHPRRRRVRAGGLRPADGADAVLRGPRDRPHRAGGGRRHLYRHRHGDGGDARAARPARALHAGDQHGAGHRRAGWCAAGRAAGAHVRLAHRIHRAGDDGLASRRWRSISSCRAACPATR